MGKYFPKSYKPFGRDINVKVDLSNYATKTDVSHVDDSSFALKSNLASLRTEVDKIDADKLKAVPVDLAKLSNVVENGVIKKTEYNSLKTKVDNIDVSGLLPTSTFNSKITEVEGKITTVDGKIPDISGLVTKTSIISLASKTKLKNLENKIPNSNAFVKKIKQIMPQKLVR